MRSGSIAAAPAAPWEGSTQPVTSPAQRRGSLELAHAGSVVVASVGDDGSVSIGRTAARSASVPQSFPSQRLLSQAHGGGGRWAVLVHVLNTCLICRSAYVPVASSIAAPAHQGRPACCIQRRRILQCRCVHVLLGGRARTLPGKVKNQYCIMLTCSPVILAAAMELAHTRLEGEARSQAPLGTASSFTSARMSQLKTLEPLLPRLTMVHEEALARAKAVTDATIRWVHPVVCRLDASDRTNSHEGGAVASYAIDEARCCDRRWRRQLPCLLRSCRR